MCFDLFICLIVYFVYNVIICLKVLICIIFEYEKLILKDVIEIKLKKIKI